MTNASCQPLDHEESGQESTKASQRCGGIEVAAAALLELVDEDPGALDAALGLVLG